jgi:flagellin
MSVVINTNVDSQKVQNILSSATNKLSQSMQRMSTGLKVQSAKDDAAGCVIAARMNVQMDGNKIAQQNVQNASAMLSTAEGHLDVVQDNLSRIRDLTLQARNGTYSTAEKEAMNDEVQERIAEINRISDSSKYSSLKLFGDATGLAKTGTDGGATFQVGANADSNDRIQASSDLFQSVKFDDLIKQATEGDGGLTSTEISNFKTKTARTSDTTIDKAFDLSKLSAAQLDVAIKALDKGIDNLTSRKSIIGSVQNRLASALDTLTTQYENLSSAKSIITDADVADEASKYTQQSILQQVSTSLLAQANQAPSIALSLI